MNVLSALAARITSGEPADLILASATAEGVDLIVLGSHGAATDRALLGSVARAVATQAGCAVLVAHPRSYGRDALPRMPSAAQYMRIRRVLAVLGPGMITGAADDDPSGIATYAQTGAQFGYGQFWTVFLMLPFDEQ